MSQAQVVQVHNDAVRLLILPALPDQPSGLPLYETKDKAQDADQHVDEEGTPDYFLEPFVWEDSQKESQDRCFDDRYGKDVALLDG